MAKKCYQIWQKVAKVAKKCYQMWQKVAKGVLSGSKRFQGLPRASKGHGLSRPPTGSHGLPRATTEFQRGVSRGIPRGSATGCGKKSPNGFHGTWARAPACVAGPKGQPACGAGPKGQRRRRAVGAGPKSPRIKAPSLPSEGRQTSN